MREKKITGRSEKLNLLDESLARQLEFTGEKATKRKHAKK